MQIHKEKRDYQRYRHKSPMHLYRMDDQDHYYYAEMKDYSKGGLSFLTNERLVVGHLVYLEMKNYDEHATGAEKHKNYRGSVKWVNSYSSSDSDTKGPNTYGIEFNEPDYYNC